MTAKFTTASNTTVADRTNNISGSPRQLSDGYFVFLRYDPSQASGSRVDLCYSPPDMSSITVILAGVDGGFTGMNLTTTGAGGASNESDPGIGLCRDSSDNLYLIASTASASQAFKCQALTKGAGHTWTAQTVLSGNMSLSGGTLYNPSKFKMAWCNTGTGTNNAGYLMVQYWCSDSGSGNATIGYAILDAGILLAGSGAVPTTSGINPSYMLAGSSPAANFNVADPHDLAPDGFGATSGLGISYDVWSINAISIGRWGVSTTGTLTTNTNITPSAATGAGSWKRSRIVRYASDSWVAIYNSDVNAGRFKLQRFSSTALVGSAVEISPPANFPSTPASTVNWDVFLDPVTANKIWLVGIHASTATTLVMLGVDLTSGITPDGAITTIDTAVGSGTDSSLCCVREPGSRYVQILVQNLNSTTYSLLGALQLFSFTATATQTGTARISKSFTKTQTATAKIVLIRTKTQTATARIRAVDTLTQTATARIRKSFTTTTTATARISITTTKTQTARSRIRSIVSATQTANARIRRTGLTSTQTATARVSKSFTATRNGTARISTTPTKTQQATARIRTVGITTTQTATAQIRRSGITTTQSATARISLTTTKPQQATAHLRSIVSATQLASARIRAAITAAQTATARVRITTTTTQTATAHINPAPAAAPVITETGSANAKTTATTLAIALSSTSYAVGDLIGVQFTMNPAAGAVTFAKTAGTATIGSFTTVEDIANGSGTSGVRQVMAWALVTGAGTITTVTVTCPSNAARAGETYKIAGADNTTPVQAHGSSTTAPPSLALTAGTSVSICSFLAEEGPVGDAVTDSISFTGTTPGTTNQVQDTTTDGTTGGSPSSNVSSALAAWGVAGVISATTAATPSATTGGTSAWIGVVFQSPQAGQFTATQTATARLSTPGSATQPATARVQVAATVTQPATARVQAARSRTQTATARVRSVVSAQQPATARLSKSAIATQTASARISTAGTKTQPATARVALTTTKTQAANARLQKSFTATQTGTARLVFGGWSADNLLNPWQDVTITGAWQDQSGGTTNLYAAIDENTPDDADYIISPAASSSVYETRIEKTTDPLVSSGHVIHVRYKKSAAANTVDLKVELVQGTTIIATRTYTNITTAFVTADETLTAPETDSITDYTDLRLRFTVTES